MVLLRFHFFFFDKLMHLIPVHNGFLDFSLAGQPKPSKMPVWLAKGVVYVSETEERESSVCQFKPLWRVETVFSTRHS